MKIMQKNLAMMKKSCNDKNLSSNLAHAIGHNLGFGHDDMPGNQGMEIGDMGIPWYDDIHYMTGVQSDFSSQRWRRPGKWQCTMMMMMMITKVTMHYVRKVTESYWVRVMLLKGEGGYSAYSALIGEKQ